MSDISLRTALDTYTGSSPKPLGRVDVFAGVTGRRRPWSLEQKLAILSEAEGCANLCELARRYDIRTSQIYTWRRVLMDTAPVVRSVEHEATEPLFVPVVADAAKQVPAEGMAVEIEIDGDVVRIFRCANIAMAAAVIRALKGAR